MTRIGTVWDRTTDVLAGRGNILAGIALVLFVVPSVAQSAVLDLVVSPLTADHIKGVIGVIVAILTIWGTLSLTAVGSDPAVTRDRGFAIARNRLLAGLGVILVAVVVAMLAALPGIYLLSTAGFDWNRAVLGLPQPDLDVGKAGFALLYFLAYALVGLWISARLVPLFAVVVNERLGLGAFRRSFALTRGSTLKLIGVLILYAIVLFVAMLAASSIVGLVFRLILGGEAQATIVFIVASVTAIVTAIFSVLQCVFSAQFYLAARDGMTPTT